MIIEAKYIALLLVDAIMERVAMRRLSSLGMTHVRVASGLSLDFHTHMYLQFVIGRVQIRIIW